MGSKLKVLRRKPGYQWALAEDMKRKIISDATHKAVCDATGTDGLGRCALYARIGQALATVHLGKQYHFQCGSLTLVFAPEICVQMLAEDNGVERGEFHCWFGCQDRNEIVDLSARHYRRFVNDGVDAGRLDIRFRWPAGLAETEYVWSRFSSSPCQIAQFEVDPMQTQRLLDSPEVQAWFEEGSDVRLATQAAAIDVQRRIERLKR